MTDLSLDELRTLHLATHYLDTFYSGPVSSDDLIAVTTELREKLDGMIREKSPEDKPEGPGKKTRMG